MLLIEYDRTIKDVKAVNEPEYLAWISVAIDQEYWPKEVGSEFQKARMDANFRKFRVVFKQVWELTPDFIGGCLPTQDRIDYLARWQRENPEGIPI